ncbi:hypothetical protein GCM10018793_09350 [Streptomyces sulfonofaciens]|uniref:Uncharacterized protein n=1 Tax=Streptomyces sulfonofaciens TaxID=68272 RepID=A0A919FV18_9ACTN|nr:hypothetical protein GCM10018793_09350 [Streptomyces sulfonofaciens]
MRANVGKTVAGPRRDRVKTKLLKGYPAVAKAVRDTVPGRLRQAGTGWPAGKSGEWTNGAVVALCIGGGHVNE